MAQPLPMGDFDPGRVIQAIGDITPSAYGPDSRITVTQGGPSFTTIVGQDGHVIRVKQRSAQAAWTIAFTLMRTDPANDELGALHKKDLDGVDGAGIVKYLLADNNGSEKVSSAQCWVVGYPELGYSAAGDTRTWTLALASADVQPGSLKQF